jgi:hypothetical protein
VEIAKREADRQVAKLIRMLQFGPSEARGVAPGRFIGEDHTERGGATEVLRQGRYDPRGVSGRAPDSLRRRAPAAISG